ncbi:MAG TPA: RNA polymerase sigma factor [Pyrinomonadaceae bacterium]
MGIIDPNVRRAADGDATAFEGLYRIYRGRVYSLCLRMTRNASDAEDLTQDVFVQLFRKLKSFRGESSFTTWLHRLTVNEVLMHFRRPAVRMEQTTEDGTIPIQITTLTDVFRTSLVDHVSLNEGIRQLSPGYRMVFLLHDVAGYEHQQIGKILGCAVGTSKSQLHKARMKLRGFLSKRALPKDGGTNEKMLNHKKKAYCAAPC